MVWMIEMIEMDLYVKISSWFVLSIWLIGSDEIFKVVYEILRCDFIYQ